MALKTSKMKAILEKIAKILYSKRFVTLLGFILTQMDDADICKTLFDKYLSSELFQLILEHRFTEDGSSTLKSKIMAIFPIPADFLKIHDHTISNEELLQIGLKKNFTRIAEQYLSKLELQAKSHLLQNIDIEVLQELEYL